MLFLPATRCISAQSRVRSRACFRRRAGPLGRSARHLPPRAYCCSPTGSPTCWRGSRSELRSSACWRRRAAPRADTTGRTEMPSHPHQLGLLPATEQRALFERGALSPVDVLEAQIAQIERNGAALNALTFAHFDSAREAARDSEARYRAGTARALEGITVAVKDEYSRKGWTVTAGSCLFEHDVKDDNHPIIDKLLEAG